MTCDVRSTEKEYDICSLYSVVTPPGSRVRCGAVRYFRTWVAPCFYDGTDDFIRAASRESCAASQERKIRWGQHENNNKAPAWKMGEVSIVDVVGVRVDINARIPCRRK